MRKSNKVENGDDYRGKRALFTYGGRGVIESLLKAQNLKQNTRSGWWHHKKQRWKLLVISLS